MFRKLASLLTGKTILTEADAVFTFHPEQLSRWLDEVWADAAINNWTSAIHTSLPLSTPIPLGDAEAVNMTKLPDLLRSDLQSGLNTPTPPAIPPPPPLPLPLGYNTTAVALATA